MSVSTLLHHPDMMVGAVDVPDWLFERGVQRVRMLVDEAVTGTYGRFLERLLSRRFEVSVETLSGAADEHRAIGLPWLDDALTRDTPDAIVAVGGGRVIDAAKLLRACSENQSVRLRLGRAERCGWTPLPESRAGGPILVAVPTTIGTGSEASRFACYDDHSGRRLVQGEVLFPDLGVLDITATRGNTYVQMAQSIVEIFSRIAGTYLGTTRSALTQDRLTETLCTRLVEIGNELSARRGEMDVVTEELRGELAHISNIGHSQWLNHERDPFSSSIWFIATELSTSAVTSKSAALAALFPHVVEQGGLVREERVSRLWDVVSAGDSSLPVSASEGLVELFRRWGLRGNLMIREDIDALVRRTMRRWGSGLPMLHAVSPATISQVYRSCVVVADDQDSQDSHRIPVSP